ncbi:hypothetical protein DJ531_12280, partial [Sulfolobus sp. A20-N-F6]
MEEKYLLDTDILVSKQFVKVKEPFIVSLVSIIELAIVIRRKHHELIKRGERRRAEGYLNFLYLTLSQIKDVVVEVSLKDVEEGIKIMFERDVNLGEAINAVIAKRLNYTVVSNDKDWE